MISSSGLLDIYQFHILLQPSAAVLASPLPKIKEIKPSSQSFILLPYLHDKHDFMRCCHPLTPGPAHVANSVT